MRTIALKKCPRIHAVFFSADGTRLLVVGGANSYHISDAISVDVLGGQEIGRTALDDPACYNVDPALNRLVVGGEEAESGDATVRWTSVPSGSDWRELAIAGAGAICDVAFDRSGTQLAVASEPRRGRARCRVDVFAFAPGTAPEHRLSIPTKRAAGELEFNADGTRLAVGAGEGGANVFEVFDLRTAERVLRFDPKVDQGRYVRFLSDDRVAASGGSKVYVLPLNGRKPQFVLGGKGKALVNDVVVVADGRRLVAGMSNGTVRFWDTLTGEPGPTFAWGVGGIWAVDLAPDGLTCAAAGSKGRIVIWDVDA
jgi:WD40 repeat protein